MRMQDLPGRRYKIDDDVPIPKRGNATSNPEMYETAKKLKIGQSFLVDKVRAGVSSNLARATGYKFTQRVEGDKLRLWRIK